MKRWHFTGSCPDGTMVCEEGTGKSICNFPEQGGTKEVCDNGRAIAALPDLKDALEALLREIDYLVEDGTLCDGFVETNESYQKAYVLLEKLRTS